MNYSEIFLLILSVYLIMFAVKLDKLDIFSIYYSIKYSNKYTGEDNIEIYKVIMNYTHLILKFLCIPFCESTYFASLSRGGCYGAVFHYTEPILTEKMEKKIYWAYIFSRYNINYPLTFLYKNNEKIYKFKKIIHEDYYIAKPNRGGLGFNVNRIKGSDVEEYCRLHNNIIIQQSLMDCVGHPKHFRYTTLHDGSDFNIYIYEKKDSNSVATSGYGKSNVVLCPLQKCPKLNKMESLAIKTICKQLQSLHKELYSSIFSIGWDIMLNCDKGHNTKAYVLEGNVNHSAWAGEPSDKKKILEYKKKLKKFLNI